MPSLEEDISIRLTVTSRLENIFLIGLSIRAICSHLGFNAQETYQLELSLVEAVTNIIKHAYNFEPGKLVELSIYLQTDKIMFELCDTGRPMENFAEPSLDFDTVDPESLAEGGMGRSIMFAYLDEVVYKRVDDRNHLTMTKRLTREKL